MLSRSEARQIIDHQVDVIRGAWDEVCAEATMTKVQKQAFWGRQFLNPYAFEGYSRAPVPRAAS
jgi:serine/threonine-protein kinase HipA